MPTGPSASRMTKPRVPDLKSLTQPMWVSNGVPITRANGLLRPADVNDRSSWIRAHVRARAARQASSWRRVSRHLGAKWLLRSNAQHAAREPPPCSVPVAPPDETNTPGTGSCRLPLCNRPVAVSDCRELESSIGARLPPPSLLLITRRRSRRCAVAGRRVAAKKRRLARARLIFGSRPTTLKSRSTRDPHSAVAWATLWCEH